MELTLSSLIETIDFALLTSAEELGKQMSRKNPDSQLITKLLERNKDRIQNVTFIRATNALGDIKYGEGVFSKHTNISDREYFIQLRDNPSANLLASKPLFDRIDNKWIWLFARRINKLDGSFGGVVFAPIPVVSYRHVV